MAAGRLLAVEEPVEKAALGVVFLGLFLVGVFGFSVLGPVVAALLLLLLPAPLAQLFEGILVFGTTAADQLKAGLGGVLVAKVALEDVGRSGPGNGQALCKITSGSESDGCDYPNESCFCDNPPNFWAFFVTENQQDWLESQKGQSNAYVSDGGAQAHSWGDGKTSPPSCFYSDICS